MMYKIFSVRDTVANGFLQPFFAVNEGSAIRSLTVVVNDKNHDFHKHSTDYSLWFLGTFDDDTGVVLPAEPTRLLMLRDLQTDVA